MDLRVGDTVLFGPPGEAKAKGVIVRLGAKTRIRQLGAAHGQPEGTEWNVPSTSAYITVIAPAFGGAAGRGSVPVSKGGRYHPPEPKPRRSSRPPPPRRSSRPPPPPVHRAPASHGHGKTEHWAVAETKTLLIKWNVPPFKIEFSNAMTRALGKVNYRKRTISYSRPLWARASEEQKEEVVIHEVAHAVVENREGRKPGTSHGASWKRQMVAMGISKPSAYHNVDRTGLKRKRGDTVEMSCCGAKPFRITMKKLMSWSKIQDGEILMRWSCRACGKKPEFSTPGDRARFVEFLRGPGLRPNQMCGCGEH